MKLYWGQSHKQGENKKELHLTILAPKEHTREENLYKPKTIYILTYTQAEHIIYMYGSINKLRTVNLNTKYSLKQMLI